MKEQATLINDFAPMKAQGTLTGKEHTAGALCITAINNHKSHNMLMKSKHLLTLLLLTVVSLSAWGQNKIFDLSEYPEGITIDKGGDYTIKGKYFGLPTQETSYLSPAKIHAKAVINITAQEPVNIILDNVNITQYDYTPKDPNSDLEKLEFQYFGALYAREAKDVTIRLKGQNCLSSKNHLPAICVPNDGELVIEDGGPEGNTGELNATGGNIGAGIGSSYENNDFKGKIIIKSGIINAHGGTQSAGIGTCYNTSGGIIEILGGTVNAEGGSNSPGIGTGGYDDSATGKYNAFGTTAKNGTVIIKGGTITAKGGPYGSTGIGVGFDSDDCNITISGGIITATGTKGMPGIGSGEISAKGKIEITGGTIYANTNENQPDIDSGSQGVLVIDGNPVILTKEIHANEADRKLWNGIVYESLYGKVYQKDKNSTIVIENDVKIDGVGPVKFKRILTIPKNEDETIPTVEIKNGVTFTNYGDIKNEGIFLVSGTLISTNQSKDPESIPEITNNGKIEVTDKGNIHNDGTIANNGKVTNNGKIEVTDKGNIHNEGTIANNGDVTNNGKIEVTDKGNIHNEGAIANNGKVTNNGKIEVTDNGNIHNEGTIANNGDVTNNGKIEVTDNGDIHNEGTIANNGKVTNNGKIEVTDNGNIQNEGTIANNGKVTNNGKIEVTDNGDIHNDGTIANKGEVTNNGKIEVTDKGNIQNEGTIANNGEVTNNGKIEVTDKGNIQNEGTIANNGNVTNNGKIEVTDKGEIQNEGTIANNGNVTNNGKVEVTDKGDIHNEGTIANNGDVTNNGKIEVTDKGDIHNEGTIANNGEVTNNGKIEVTDKGEIQNSGTIDGSNTIEGNGQIFHAVTYINYDPDKDPKDLVKNVLQNDPIPLDVPTSQFSVFEGWYDKQENGQVVSAETLVTGPITIYAYWNDYKITTVTQPTTLNGTCGTELSPGYDLSTLLASDSYTTDITYSWADPDAEHYGLEIQTDSYGKYWLRGIPNKSTDSGDQIAISISSPHCKLAPVITIPVSIMSEPVYYPVYYEVTIPKVEGVRTIPSAGTHYYKEGSSISLTLILDPEYDLSTPVVKANDNTIKPNSNGRYSIAVYSDINFSIDSVKPNISVGIDNPVSTKSRIYAIDGMIHIDITTPQDVSVVTFDGRLVRRVSLPAGNNCLQALPSGFYIVKLSDGTMVKIRNS